MRPEQCFILPVAGLALSYFPYSFYVNLTEDQLLALAPDDASKKAGRDLANPSKWVSSGANEVAVWGECKGSGTKPYQTVIDAANVAFKCSCPSRKFPCKHGIALGLLHTRRAAAFTDKVPPPWVADWISKRVQKEEARSDPKTKEPDEAAQAKRQLAREQKVVAGIGELLVWIKDIVRNGINNLPDKGYAYWEGMAKRMIDAQAPGLAAMVKDLGNSNFFKEGWQSHFIDSLLSIYLVAKGYQNKHALPPLLLQDVKNHIGFTTGGDELKEQKGIADTWLVAGKQVTQDDHLTVEKTWLYGMSTGRAALILQFIVRGQGPSVLLSPGTYMKAEVVYYRSVTPLRAMLKQQTATAAKSPEGLSAAWKEVAQTETFLCSGFPVQNERPYGVEQLLPVQHNGGWWLKDSGNELTAIKDNFSGIWRLLALGGGRPLHMIVLGKERTYEPLGVWHNQTYKAV